MLSDLRAVELGNTVAAAAAGRMLQQLGAHVTRLRAGSVSAGRPGRTERERLLRILGARKEERTIIDPWGDDALAEAAEADIVIADVSDLVDGTNSGWASRYRELVERHNRAVWVTISPFGLAGPLSGCRGGDLVTSAAGGIAHYMRTSDGRPMKPAGFSSSVPAGQFATLAALHGLMASRDRSAPVHIDLSIQDTVIVTGVFLECSHVSFECSREGGSASYAAPVGLIRCNDGLVWITVLEQHHWQGCLAALGNPAWAASIVSTEDRHAKAAEIHERLNEWGAKHRALECTEILQANGVPATTVSSPATLLEGRGVDVSERFFVSGDGGELVPGVPVRFTNPISAGGRTESLASARRKRVLDLTQVLVAPLATAWLAAMGIDVLKIEEPSRLDVYRRVGPFAGDVPDPERSAYFAFVNYSKRSYAADLESPEGRRQLEALVASADVVVTNFTRRRVARLKLDPLELDDTGPSLVACSGFDRSTAHASFRAYGLNIQAAGGAVWLSTDRLGVPRNFGTSWADPLASIWIATLAAAQLVAPLERRRHAEVSMVEVIAWQFPEFFSEASLDGDAQPAEETHLDHAAPHALYRCKGEAAWLAVEIESDAEWRRFVEALGSPLLLTDERFATAADRQRHLNDLNGAVASVLANRTRDVTVKLLCDARVACAPVLNARELINHPHLLERGILQPVEHPIWGRRTLTGLPWQIVGDGPTRIFAPPLIGAHTSEDSSRWW